MSACVVNSNHVFRGSTAHSTTCQLRKACLHPERKSYRMLLRLIFPFWMLEGELLKSFNINTITFADQKQQDGIRDSCTYRQPRESDRVVIYLAKYISKSLFSKNILTPNPLKNPQKVAIHNLGYLIIGVASCNQSFGNFRKASY